MTRAARTTDLSPVPDGGHESQRGLVMDYNLAGLPFWEHIGFGYLPDDYRTLQAGTDTS